MPTSAASATWEGGLKAGKGTFEAASGLFRGPYTFPPGSRERRAPIPRS
jgi:hypothetical protein